MIPYIRAYLWSWHTCQLRKRLHPIWEFNLQSDHWTGSILRSSLYDLLDRHWFLRRYLVVFKVSFRNEVVSPGVPATSVLTSAECQHHTSSAWPWSGAPKVHLYDTFLGGLCQGLLGYTMGLLLSLRPTTPILRWEEMQNISSPDLQREEIECGSCGLNNRKSPGWSATAVPILGKVK